MDSIEIFRYQKKRIQKKREKNLGKNIGKKVMIHESRKIADLYT